MIGRDLAREVLRAEADAILRLIDRLDQRFDAAVEAILQSPGRVVVSGMGKSGIIGKKIAATLASTGTPALFLHPAEAVHGDLGMLVDGDLVLFLSHSGETAEVLRLVELLGRLGLRSVALVGQPESSLARAVDVALDCSVAREACPLGLAPTASTTAALALGDALALTVAARRGFTADDFARRHPGGQLAWRLRRVREVMVHGEAVPRVPSKARLTAAVAEMSQSGLGMTTVVDDHGILVGVVTDGDLRRLLAAGVSVADLRVDAAAEEIRRLQPPRVGGEGPLTIGGDQLASRALQLMERRQVTSLVVLAADGTVEGVVHLHALWRLQMF